MLAITAVGCVISALAPNVTVLFVGRVIQGVCGPTISLTLIMLRQQVPNEKQYALLMGILASVNGGIAGVDALAGGWRERLGSAQFSGSWPSFVPWAW